MSSESGLAIELVEPDELAATTYPLPEQLKQEGILVEMKAATACGSDMHSWRGRRPFPMPSVLGHEVVGEIASLGSSVRTDTAGNPLSVGDRITWTVMASCNDCRYCRLENMPQKCTDLFKYGHERSDERPHFNGGFAEYVHVIPGTAVFKLPSGVPSAVASTLMCAGATVAAGLDRMDLDPMDSLVVQGAGMLGLYAISMASVYGADRIIAVDIDTERLRMAERFGADSTLDANELTDTEIVDQVKEKTGGRGADAAFEVTGAPEVIPTGVELLATGGEYMLHGSVYPGDTFTLDGHDVITKNLSIQGSHNYDAQHLATAIEFADRYRDRYPLESLVGPSFPLSVDGVQQALSALENREAIRPVIRPD
ncbi:MAG: zinc-binding dehydrogenase [Halobacteriales archaeon]